MRMNTDLKKILDAANLAADQSSSIETINDILAFSIQFIWAGGSGIDGDLIVEGSNDGSTFVPVDSYTISGETDGSRLVNVERAGYAYMRARWNHTAGTGGTMTIWLSTKGL